MYFIVIIDALQSVCECRTTDRSNPHHETRSRRSVRRRAGTSGEPRDRRRVPPGDDSVGKGLSTPPRIYVSIVRSHRDRIGTRSFLLVFLIRWSSGTSTARFPRPSVVWVQVYRRLGLDGTARPATVNDKYERGKKNGDPTRRDA